MGLRFAGSLLASSPSLHHMQSWLLIALIRVRRGKSLVHGQLEAMQKHIPLVRHDVII